MGNRKGRQKDFTDRYLSGEPLEDVKPRAWMNKSGAGIIGTERVHEDYSCHFSRRQPKAA